MPTLWAHVKGFVPLMVLVLGYFLSEILDPLTPVIPYIITAMLFMTFLKVKPSDIKWRWSHLALLALQIALAIGVYLMIAPFHADAATAMLLCFLTPAATAGPSIVQILRGDTAYIASYVLITHLAFILITPFLFPYVGGIEVSEGILMQMWHIFYHVARLVLPAIVVAWLIVYLKPKVAFRLGSQTQINYSFWLLSLLLLIAHTTMYLKRSTHFEVSDLYLVASLGLVTCVLQYLLGHVIAHRLGIEQHASRHSLGQKNTSLSIWIAALFLPPLAGIGITSYIIWQNIIISSVMSYYSSKRQKTIA